jgi:hypothetical protein
LNVRKETFAFCIHIARRAQPCRTTTETRIGTSCFIPFTFLCETHMATSTGAEQLRQSPISARNDSLELYVGYTQGTLIRGVVRGCHEISWRPVRDTRNAGIPNHRPPIRSASLTNRPFFNALHNALHTLPENRNVFPVDQHCSNEICKFSD